MPEFDLFPADLGQHMVGCICTRCFAARDVEALERLYTSLDVFELERSAGVVIREAILRAREEMRA